MRTRRTAILVAMTTALVTGALGPITPARAVTISPTVFTDDNTVNSNCTLREAIRAANENAAIDACPMGSPGVDIISLQPTTSGTYTLSVPGTLEDSTASGDLDIRSNIAIQALSGTATIDGGDIDRVLHVVSAQTPAAVLTLTNVFVLNGSTADSGGGILHNSTGGLNIGGGGIGMNTSTGVGAGIHLTAGALVMNNSIVTQNTATGGIGGGLRLAPEGASTITSTSIDQNQATNGGGVSLASGDLSISLSTVTLNTVSGGGGGVAVGGGSLSISRSTVADNTAQGDSGGGLRNGATTTVERSTFEGNTAVTGGGISTSGGLTARNSTLSGNMATASGGGLWVGGSVTTANNLTIALNQANSDTTGPAGSGGGIRVEAGQLTMSNSIVADNSALPPATAHDCSKSPAAPFASSYNLIEDTVGCTRTPMGGEITGVDPNLASLQNNGDIRETHLPLAGSPAIEAGNPNVPSGVAPDCETVDQRGVARPQVVAAESEACDMGAVERNLGTFTLTGSVLGPGAINGRIYACPGDCQSDRTGGELLTLNAETDPGASFQGWSDDCTFAGTSPTCVLVMDMHHTVSATFATDKTLTVTPTGPGTVTGTGIGCPDDCSESYAHGTPVTLTASPTGAASFTGWGGACTGSATTCQVDMDDAMSVTASFAAAGKTVSLQSSKTRVRKNKRVRLTATVSPCAGHEGDSIEFFKGSTTLGSVATDEACIATMKVKMKRKATFTAVSPKQDADHLAGTSAPVTVKVRKPS